MQASSECEILALSRCFPLRLQTQTLFDAMGTSHLCQEATLTRLFSHFICAQEERWRDREAKRFGGSHVDGKVEVGRALER
jgi:hypothetical protein